MKGRFLALLLLVYVSLDLGNPLMPGALHFVDGRLEIVDAGRPPAAQPPTPATPGEAAPSWTALVQIRVPSHRVTVDERPPLWVPIRRLVRSGANAAPSPDDH